MEELLQQWDTILNNMRTEYDIPDVSFKTWIKPLTIDSVDDNKIILVYDGESMGVDYVKKKYLTFLTVAIGDVMHKEFDIDLITANDRKQRDNKESKPSYNNVNANYQNYNLNPNYTFDTFVVGNNNNLAHAAALAVAETPGKVYNPLFIYGGVGLGKTHLMQAIAQFIIQNEPELKVLYVTSETFTNELIESLKNQKTTNAEFREKYRNIDVLLIDDIQFIIGKESTQEEFFHTFNALYESKKQIVISSDKPPKEMETLTERLRTRFEMGLTADIQIPTYETKMAILNKKQELDGIDIPDDVKDYVATHIKSSIRELEGALTKLVAFSNLSHKKITVDFAEEVLKDLISPDVHRQITPELILNIVSEHFNVSTQDILSSKRKADIVLARQIVMYLCREMTEMSLQGIGEYIGNRDHTTVIHGCDKIKKDYKNNEMTRNKIDIIIKKLNPS